MGQVILPGTLSLGDQKSWADFLALQSVAFLSYSYTQTLASCLPFVRVCRITQGCRTLAFFPFQYRSAVHEAMGIGERLGGELSDYFGLIAEPEFRIEPKELLRLSGLKSLHFSHLDEKQGGNGLVGTKPEVGHRIDFPQGGEAFWEDMRRNDKKFTSDTERRERKLIREYGSVRFVFSENDSDHALRELVANKRAQYYRTGFSDVLSKRQTQNILHALYRTRDEQCSGVMSTLYAGNTWVASHFGLRCGSTLHYWFPVYNPILKAFAPGRILLKQIIQSSQANGLKCIDRGAGDSVAKRDLSTSQHLFYSGLWQQPGFIALSHRLGLAIGWRLARRAKLGKMEVE
jgi:CelD/BcsL family acetyltransferase involved in cellulose biosynthesis